MPLVRFFGNVLADQSPLLAPTTAVRRDFAESGRCAAPRERLRWGEEGTLRTMPSDKKRLAFNSRIQRGVEIDGRCAVNDRPQRRPVERERNAQI